MDKQTDVEQLSSPSSSNQGGPGRVLPIFCAYDRVSPINLLQGHPKNPNQHPDEQVHLLARILSYQGWRSPVVVSNRSHYIVAGHGRLLAAKLLNQDVVPVNFQDFPDESSELAHLIADNKIQESSFLDLSVVQDIMEDLESLKFPDLTLTGFDSKELSSMDQLVREQVESLTPSIEQESASHDPESIFMMKGNQVIFASDNLYGIPNLLNDRQLLLSCPSKLSTWTGPDSIQLTSVNPTQDASSHSPNRAIPGNATNGSLSSLDNKRILSEEHHEQQVWLYNWGTDSRRGLDMSTVIISFYTDDLRFECFWDRPFDYVARLWNNRVKGAITPNYSLWDTNPLALNVFNIYRSRWVGRYMQEAGIPIIPDVAGLTSVNNLEFCMEGIPKNVPCISVQIQTSEKTIEETISRRRGLLQCIDKIRPEQLLLYVGDNWEKIIPPDILPKSLDLHVVSNRIQNRRKIMNQNRKPTSYGRR